MELVTRRVISFATSRARSTDSNCAPRSGCDVAAGQVPGETGRAPARVFAHADVNSCLKHSMAARGARALSGAHRRPDLMALPTSGMANRPLGRICVPDRLDKLARGMSPGPFPYEKASRWSDPQRFWSVVARVRAHWR